MQTFYITTPIYYANSLPHLGHLYTTIVADAIHRYKKQRGFDVYFLTGTDEHGINIQRAAEREGRTPKEQADYISGELKRMFAISVSIRKTAVTTFSCGRPSRFITTVFSICGARSRRTRRRKGTTTSTKDFTRAGSAPRVPRSRPRTSTRRPKVRTFPLCLIHERPLDQVSEESYFFRLSDYGDTLLDIIEKDPLRIRPDARRNEVISFIKRGLQDLSISRLKTSVSWGVPVPDDEDHVMYVWLDALSNYITALGYGNEERASAGFEKYWPAMHLVGKDILRFHTVYWFSFLLAAGLELPQTVYAHGMWLDADGRKMGKTLGNVIEVDVLHEHFQVDALRYFVLREMVFGQDGKFGYENLIDRANADLASGLGNLAARTFSMISKYRDGMIPSGKIAEENYINARRAGIDPDGGEIVSVLEHARDEFIRRFDNFEFSQALETLWTVIARIDKMISDTKPWELAKDEKQSETLNAVLYRATETLRWLSVMLYPVMPEASEKIYRQIGLNDEVAKLDPADLKWGELAAGTTIGETEAVFPRIDKNKVMSEISGQKSEVSSQKPEVGSQKAAAVAEGSANDKEQRTNDEGKFITIDDFLKVELRVGEIKVAERVPNADKLLRFEVDLGEEKPRQILAGLAEYYDPEKLIGRKVVVVANLKPRKMRGLESQGMICAASLTEEDTPAIATFLEDVKVGARLK